MLKFIRYNEDISIRPKIVYKIVVPFIGVAHAAQIMAQQFYTDLFLYPQC